MRQFFAEEQILKCAFHASHLLNRGLLKELTRLKNEKYHYEIKELAFLGRFSLEIEAKDKILTLKEFKFTDSKQAWQVYLKLRSIFSINNPSKIQADFLAYLTNLSITHWKGADLLKEKCISLLPTRGLTAKSLEFFKLRVYRAWRAILRSYRKNLEDLKSGFQDAKYLVLMNPINMDAREKRALRKALKKFPWLRSIRRIMTKFYYQFRLSPSKRSSLTFLMALVTESCHSWPKSAVNTLITCEEQIFRFQVLMEQNPALKDVKAIKVVDEATMRKINKLYQTQFGMRTVETLEMRLKTYLECPFIIAPSVLEELKS
ncbi:MAG: hypothetical protein GF311_11655 [Candidatus Lokiarchaeota archaeon]|nr:hypothetical protein [Candidatus Lokiarchaeota archaeon]